MAYIDFSKFYRIPFTRGDFLSKEGNDALKEAVSRADTALAHVAADIPLTPTGSVASTNLQDAVTELDLEKVPVTRTVNAQALSADVVLTATDVGADPAGTADAAVALLALQTEIAGLREEVAVLRTKINDILQGTML
jgi:hypothetical protein